VVVWNAVFSVVREPLRLSLLYSTHLDLYIFADGVEWELLVGVVVCRWIVPVELEEPH
jgi:hypothetical protein